MLRFPRRARSFAGMLLLLVAAAIVSPLTSWAGGPGSPDEVDSPAAHGTPSHPSPQGWPADSAWSGVWSEWSPLRLRRDRHQAIYDPVRRRMLVFGQPEGGSVFEVWALPLDAPELWSPLTIRGPLLPRERRYSSVIYDPLRDRAIVFGGIDRDSTPLDETWELDLRGQPRWRRLDLAHPPPARFGHSAIYDEVGDRMVIFAGRGTSRYLDTWVLPLQQPRAWESLAVAPPALNEIVDGAAVYLPRSRSMLVDRRGTFQLDRARNRLIHITSNGSSYWDADSTFFFELPLAAGGTWRRQRSTSTAGVLREIPTPTNFAHVGIVDPVARRVLVHVGTTPLIGDFNSHATPGDVWALSIDDPSEWTRVLPAVAQPLAVLDPPLAFDPTRRQLYTYPAYYESFFNGRCPAVGGVCLPSHLNQRAGLWRMGVDDDVPIWQSIAAPLADVPPQLSAEAVYDSGRDEIVVFGGDCRDPLSTCQRQHGVQIWSAATGARTRYGPTTTLVPPGWPEGRAGHTLVYDPDHQNVLLFGMGPSPSTPIRADTWILERPATGVQWTRVLASSAQGSLRRTYHSAILDRPRRRMLVFGGRAWLGGPLNDVWAFSTDTRQWQQIVVPGEVPERRYGHSAIYDSKRDRMVIFGGTSREPVMLPSGSIGILPGEELGCWALSLSDEPRWQRLRFKGETPGSWYHNAAVYDAAKDRMIIWRGGVEDIRTLPLEQPVWSVSFHDSDDEVVLTPATDERAMRLASSAATVPALALEVESPQRGTSIRVRFRAPAGEGATLELLDVGGRRLDRTIVTADAAGTGTGTLGRGARHPNGVYFVRATGAGVQATRRLVVME